MRFGRPVQPQQKDGQQNREPLLRLGGLYDSKSGNAITGNIRLNYQRQNGATVGEELIDLIKQMMEEDRPLKFLVFENNGKYGSNKAPYQLSVTAGYKPEDSRSATPPRRAPQRQRPAPVEQEPEDSYEEPDGTDIPDDEVADDPPQQAPPIRRRTAPRRA